MRLRSAQRRLGHSLYVVIVRYFVAGIPGAAGALSLAVPALLAIPVARIVLRGQSGPAWGASGIVIASCGLMVAAGVRLAPQAAPTSGYIAVADVGVMALALRRSSGVGDLRVVRPKGRERASIPAHARLRERHGNAA
jgi:hypothetical protein